MTMHAMDCTTLDDQLADYLEGDFASADRRQTEAHLATCARCTPLVRDLERIRADASELPELTPSADLWSGIARRIEAPVVPLAPRAAPNVTTRRRFERLRTAAIAAALVAVTASVTYTLTVARVSARSGESIAADTQGAPTPDTNAASSVRDEPRRDTLPSSNVGPAPE